MADQAEDQDVEAKPAPKFDLASIIDRMNEQQLIVALVAISPELDDILPDDPQLKRDVDSAREKITERQLSLTEDTKQVSQVVEQSVHIHLWDEQTSARVKELGGAVINLFQDIKDKLVEGKKKYIDGDDRNVISFEDAFSGFRDGLRDMADFITRRDRPEDTPTPRSEAEKPPAPEDAAPDLKLKPWHYVAGAFGAVPSKELIESLHPDDEKPVVRLASSAVGDVLDDELQPAAKVGGGFVFGQDEDDEEGYEDDDDLVAVSPEPAAEAGTASPAPEGRKAGDSNFYLTRRITNAHEAEELAQHLEQQGIHPARIDVDTRPMAWNELRVECSSALELQDSATAIESFYDGDTPSPKPGGNVEGKQLSLSAQALGM